MPGTNTIALWAVIATAATAIATVGGSLWENQRRFRQDRLAKDLDELRILLDDCAQAIFIYTQALQRTEKRYDESDTDDPDHYSKQLFYLRGRDETASYLNQRIVIRLGREHEVAEAFGAAIKPLYDAYTLLMTSIESRQMAAHGETAKREQQAASRKQAYEAYLDAAHALVASTVEPPRRSRKKKKQPGGMPGGVA